MARSKRSVEREEFWRLVLDDQRRSGLNVRKFCQREAISEPSFYSWRRRFRSRDEQATDSAINGGRLIPVAVVGATCENEARLDPPSNRLLEIGTPGGFTLRFDRDTTPETLSRLLDVLARCGPEGAASC